MRHTALLLLAMAISPLSHAQPLGDRLGQLLAPATPAGAALTEPEAASGIKEALAQGTRNAVLRLGKRDGFLADQAVRIATPKSLRKLVKTARKLGAGAQVDAFETAMNRAAEQAVPAAADIFADAVRGMSVHDALGIVRGGEDAGTQYFRRVSEERLRSAFTPIVAKATASTEVTQRYKALTSKAGGLTTLLGADHTDLDAYVTDKTMDGLFHYVAEEEKAIRSNPLKRGSELLGRVFGG